MTRWDCRRWLSKRGYPDPPKSACYFCPYQDNARWRHLRDTSSLEWADAVALDHAIRKGVAPNRREQEWFLHAARIPLDQVDLSTPEDHGQLTMFDEECAGVCGV